MLKETTVNVRKLREKLGVSREELSKMVGVSLQTLTMWENWGISPRRKKFLQKMVELDGGDVSKIVYRRQKPFVYGEPEELYTEEYETEKLELPIVKEEREKIKIDFIYSHQRKR